MELEVYMSSRNFEINEFAKLLGISSRAFFNYRKGVRDWPLSLALKVVEITHNKVTVYDLVKTYLKNNS